LTEHARDIWAKTSEACATEPVGAEEDVDARYGTRAGVSPTRNLQAGIVAGDDSFTVVNVPDNDRTESDADAPHVRRRTVGEGDHSADRRLLVNSVVDGQTGRREAA
jgi:hypothetical protein